MKEESRIVRPNITLFGHPLHSRSYFSSNSASFTKTILYSNIENKRDVLFHPRVSVPSTSRPFPSEQYTKIHETTTSTKWKKRKSSETLENPARFKVNQSPKERINELEQTIIQLKSESISDESKPPLRSNEAEVIQTPTECNESIKLMDKREYFGTEQEVFEIEKKARLVLIQRRKMDMTTKEPFETARTVVDSSKCD
ncbi:hypothetical protein BC830DRAFT_908913 [Chytriomyces sp. MP71]|nr:hypothetical protein BC830DRAFT_908913 [Chytriomyces sp. MP71]